MKRLIVFIPLILTIGLALLSAFRSYPLTFDFRKLTNSNRIQKIGVHNGSIFLYEVSQTDADYLVSCVFEMYLIQNASSNHVKNVLGSYPFTTGDTVKVNDKVMKYSKVIGDDVTLYSLPIWIMIIITLFGGFALCFVNLKKYRSPG